MYHTTHKHTCQTRHTDHIQHIRHTHTAHTHVPDSIHGPHITHMTRTRHTHIRTRHNARTTHNTRNAHTRHTHVPDSVHGPHTTHGTHTYSVQHTYSTQHTHGSHNTRTRHTPLHGTHTRHTRSTHCPCGPLLPVHQPKVQPGNLGKDLQARPPRRGHVPFAVPEWALVFRDPVEKGKKLRRRRVKNTGHKGFSKTSFYSDKVKRTPFSQVKSIIYDGAD